MSGSNLLIDQATKAIDEVGEKWSPIAISAAKEAVDLGTPDIIYHYTNYEGLRGILEKQDLWVSNIFRMNDPSELTYGLQTLYETLETEIKGNGTAWDRFLSDFRNTLRDRIEDIGVHLICCFSGNGDELGQWRAYADDGRGYCVGFDSSALKNHFNLLGQGSWSVSTFRIDYDKSRTRRNSRFKQFVDIMMPVIKSAISLLESNQISITQWRQLESKLHIELALAGVMISYFHKHHGYESEDEYRFLLVRSRAHPFTDLEARIRRDRVVDYFKFNWKACIPCPIKIVRVGPAANFKKAKSFIRDCCRLGSLDYDKLNIDQSDIPYTSLSDR